MNYLCISYVLFVDIFTRSFDDFISLKFLIVFLPASPFTKIEDFCQPPRLMDPPRLLFQPKFASVTVYSALPFYLKLESISCFPCEKIFNRGSSATASEFPDLVQVRINVYIRHCKYHVKLHLHEFQHLVQYNYSFLPYLIDMTSFRCTNRINFLFLSVSSDRLVIVAKGFLKLSNLPMLKKQRSLSFANCQ